MSQRPPKERPIPDKALAAMIGLLPLPGSPGYRGDDAAIVHRALDDLDAYRQAGADCVLLENSHDLPYIKPPLDEGAVDLVEHIAHEVRDRFEGPIGLQLLEAANETALDIAERADLDFVRVEGYVFAHVGGAGIIEGCAGSLLRRRRTLGCDHIRVLGDVKKKHCSHALTADLDITDVVRQAEFFHVDGVVVTGDRTGASPDPGDVEAVRDAASGPVWIGSGMTPENITTFAPIADGFIVGSTLRENGAFLGELDTERLARFVAAFRDATT